MANNLDPESVWLYYYPNGETVAEASQHIFQRILTDEEYVQILDARTGEVIRINMYHHKQPSGSVISMICFRLNRAIKVGTWQGRMHVEYGISHDGSKPQLLLLDFHIPHEAQYKSLATCIFATQVQAACTFGFQSILAYAAGGKAIEDTKKHSFLQQLAEAGVGFEEESDNRNGYYTWPRLGFDKCLSTEEKALLAPEFQHLTYLREILEQPEGCEWWREHGFAVEVAFDTDPHSYSMQRLQNALHTFRQKNAYWESGKDMPLRIERGSTLRPRRGWQQRIWEYRKWETK